MCITRKLRNVSGVSLVHRKAGPADQGNSPFSRSEQMEHSTQNVLIKNLIFAASWTIHPQNQNTDAGTAAERARLSCCDQRGNNRRCENRWIELVSWIRSQRTLLTFFKHQISVPVLEPQNWYFLRAGSKVKDDLSMKIILQVSVGTYLRR